MKKILKIIFGKPQEQPKQEIKVITTFPENQLFKTQKLMKNVFDKI